MKEDAVKLLRSAQQLEAGELRVGANVPGFK
jgi:hypothetical protein